MAIPAGTRLGAYEVVAQIGAGGMGEVYKARDTRLDRIVAIKVLPQHLADKPEVRERFEREARTIASLNHPHICTLYDVGHQDGIDFLVMEYLEGETLATRLLKGPLPLEQVLQYAVEISDALDKAHRKGVTHRDIKPGNVMLTKSGTKLLDFGLAKLKQVAAPAAMPVSQMSTLSQNPTIEGTLLGTLQYMAPEQVEGKVDEIDGRTDIFAFGALVYEMATGKKAFEGKTQASLIAKLLEHDPPPISSLQPLTPPALDLIVKTCLAKEPDERWQTASDLCRQLKWLAEGRSASAGHVVTSVDRSQFPRRWALVAVVASLVVTATVGVVGWILKPAPAPPPKPVSRLTITLPAGDQLAALDWPAIAISPDGKQLAYVAIRGGTRQIYLRGLDSLEAQPLAGTEGANTPFFSPDGGSLGFVSGNSLKKISVSGGTPVTLANIATSHGASWAIGGTIAFTPRTSSPLLRVSEAGGASQPLTHLERGETTDEWPEFLPNGESVLFDTGGANPRIASQSLATGQRRDVVPNGAYPRYATSGHLIYAQGGNLMAVPFDPRQLQVTGAAVAVVEGVLSIAANGGMQYGVSASGSLVYVPGKTAGAAEHLVWVSRDGTEQVLAAPPHNYTYPRISPDGRQVAVNIAESERQIWLYDLARDTLTRLTFSGNFNRIATWTLDGKHIAFASNKEGPQNIFWQLADGSGGQERLTTSEYVQLPRSFSPDGQLLAFVEVNLTTANDIWVLRLSDHKAQPFLKTPFNESAPSFSPDGHWLAYVSDESGRYEVYVQPYPGPGGRYQISTDGGNEPVWNPNGKELFYRSGEKMMAVDTTTQPSFSVGKSKMLFQGSYVPAGAAFPYYDVSPDGQRFLMIKPSEQSSSSATQIVVVQNWFEELKRRVPTGTK